MSENRFPADLKTTRRFFFIGIVTLLVSVTVLIGMVVRQRQEMGREISGRAQSLREGPRVNVIAATRGAATRTVSYVGEGRPYTTVTMYAKVSGYLRTIQVDKGDKVTEGQLLAVIESPELDRQYDAAVADAKSKLADMERARGLLETGAVSLQSFQQTEASARVAQETAASLQAQKDYELMRAPFTGHVTARFADPGALLQAATSSETTALPVVTVSQIDRLRVFIYPDQRTAAWIRVGDPAEVADSTRPNVKVSASISRISGQLDARTRTMLIEIDVDNREGRILAGSFVQVTLSIQVEPYIQIPVEALVMRGDKASVAVLGPDNRVNFRPVTIYDSDAKKVHIASGVDEGEKLIVHLGQSVQEGQVVQPVEAAESETKEK